MRLKDKKCLPCEGGVPKLKEEQIKELMNSIDSGWSVIENIKIKKEFRFVNFVHTMEFVNKVAVLSEEEGHHPDLAVSYGKCDIVIWTHTLGGLSENDFILAAKIDTLN
jgi:4a-hydroxytetrahydrobiopterin dehydratase